MLLLPEQRQCGRPIFAMNNYHRMTMRASLLIVGIEAAPAFSQPLAKSRRFHDILPLEVSNS